MFEILTTDQMYDADRKTIDGGIPGDVHQAAVRKRAATIKVAKGTGQSATVFDRAVAVGCEIKRAFIQCRAIGDGKTTNGYIAVQDCRAGTDGNIVTRRRDSIEGPVSGRAEQAVP